MKRSISGLVVGLGWCAALLAGVAGVVGVAGCSGTSAGTGTSMSLVARESGTWALAPAVGAAEVPPPRTSKKSKHAFKGAPVSTNSDSVYVLLKNKGYDVGYSESRKDPLWAAYTFRNDAEEFEVKRPKNKRFTVDARVQAGVTHNDYDRTGYDRGHMAPSDAIGRWYGNEAQLGTFIVTNICPQKHDNNAGDWAGLEAAVSDVYAEDFDQVWVLCGPIFDAHPKVIGDDIAVPVAFYKIVVEDDDDGDPEVLAVVMDQGIKGTHELSTYVTTVRKIEGLTRLNFFPELVQTVQDRIETKEADPGVWKTDMRLEGQSIRNN